MGGMPARPAVCSTRYLPNIPSFLFYKHLQLLSATLFTVTMPSTSTTTTQSGRNSRSAGTHRRHEMSSRRKTVRWWSRPVSVARIIAATARRRKPALPLPTKTPAVCAHQLREGKRPDSKTLIVPPCPAFAAKPTIQLPKIPPQAPLTYSVSVRMEFSGGTGTLSPALGMTCQWWAILDLNQ